MTAVTGSEWCDGTRAVSRRVLTLIAVAAMVTATASCSGTAASEAPPTTATTTVAPPVPATAGATEGGLSAPHSGDRPVAAGCTDGGEMLDWDGDGWGDCVNPGAPARPSLPATGG